MQALWLGIIPTLLAALVVRFLVPRVASGPAEFVAHLAGQYWLPFGVGLFFLFSWMARYWRFRVPGGRHASPLPAHLVPNERDDERLGEWASFAALHKLFISSGMRRRLRRMADETGKLAIDRQLGDLGGSLESGDYTTARSAASALEALAAGALASRRRSEALGVAGAMVAAVAAALGARTFIEPYRVLSGSMLPTLEPEDLVISNRLAYRPLIGGGSAAAAGKLPRRGDLILFQSDAVGLHKAGGPELLVKRVIGLPGDRISMRGDVPVINDWMVPYCGAGKYLYIGADGEMMRGKVRVEFLEDRVYLTLQSLWTAFDGTYVVKPGEVFVLGDSRSSSMDSRTWNEGHGGGVPLEAITGRAQWFLMGRDRSGDADFGRLLRPLDKLGRKLRLEGPDAQQLEDGIAKCLRNPPAVTRPPEAPGNPPGAPASANPGT